MVNNDDLLSRLKKLEAQNFRIKVSTGLLFAVMLGLLVAGQIKNQKTVEAKEFILRDQSGNVAARLGHTDMQTCLELLSHTKVMTAEICVGDDYGSSLALANRRLQARAFLSAGTRLSESGTGPLSPGLTLAQESDKHLSATLGTETRVVIGQGSQEYTILFFVQQGKPTIHLLNPGGKVLWSSQ